MSPKMARCMARGPNLSACRTPCHFLTGCGGFHRKSPTGGSANGIPLKTRIPSCSAVPSTAPFFVSTRSPAKAAPLSDMVSKIAQARSALSLIEFVLVADVGGQFPSANTIYGMSECLE